jgi:hypothetical protein
MFAAYSSESVDYACDGDTGLREDVSDLGLAQTRGIVLERELIFLFVDAKAP